MALEDQRSAATLYTSLSSYVMTASLGVIAAQAAIATFVLDKREPTRCFYALIIVGFTASVLSIVFGGKGVAALASNGFKGVWTLKPSGDPFNLQAAFCLIGMLMLLFSIFTGKAKPDSPSVEQIRQLTISASQQASQIRDLRTQTSALSEQLKLLSGGATHRQVKHHH